MPPDTIPGRMIETGAALRIVGWTIAATALAEAPWTVSLTAAVLLILGGYGRRWMAAEVERGEADDDKY